MTKDCSATLRKLVKNPVAAVPANEVVDWGLEALGVPGLWSMTRGEGIKIGVIDTGADLKHTDLVGAIADSRTFGVRDGAEAWDHIGHGTHVCGIIAARDNNQGIIGVAPRSKLYIAKVLDCEEDLDADVIAEAIDWCVEKGVDIINISLALYDGSDALEEAVERAVEANVAIVAAAGNEGNYQDFICYPAKYRGVLCVGSVDRNRKLSPTSSVGNRLDLLAPGEEIYSTFPLGIYAKLSGTSMACPFVTGIAALVLARHRDYKPVSTTPCDTPAQLREHLLASATPIKTAESVNYTGFRVINPDGAKA
ncbi:MAG: S8 family peptidase [Solidesulfovibrio sp. DCME]|uniref:S8 family peptidase n=1 Tax=Solidesulfovibrio sp. DCME TaxID=3447380 RepID=UPI003D10AF41